jgi:hypothetical protein
MSEEKKLGIENLKRVVLLGIELTKETERTLGNGKFNIFKSFNFVDEIKDFVEILPLFPTVKEEFKDLDESERTEIILFVRTKLSLENEWAEKLTESGLNLIVAIWGSAEVWKNYQNREK